MILWYVFALGLPMLCAAWCFDKVYAARGPAAFANPGGWRFPVGEVAVFAGGFAGLFLVLLVAAVVTK